MLVGSRSGLRSLWSWQAGPIDVCRLRAWFFSGSRNHVEESSGCRFFATYPLQHFGQESDLWQNLQGKCLVIALKNMWRWQAELQVCFGIKHSLENTNCFEVLEHGPIQANGAFLCLLANVTRVLSMLSDGASVAIDGAVCLGFETLDGEICKVKQRNPWHRYTFGW